MTLIECILSLIILSMAMLTVVYTVNAGHHHLNQGDTMLRAMRLAENLVEEILSRPYDGTGATRENYCMDDYDGFSEGAGNITDAANMVLPEFDQIFNRFATVNPVTLNVSDLDNTTITGKSIVVSVTDYMGRTQQISRFVAEPTP